MKYTYKIMSVLILIWLSIYSVSFAQKFHVIDVNKETNSHPVNAYWGGFYDDTYTKFEYAVLNGVAYFSADDGVHGKELWRSDGTSGGTWMIKDINPGIASSIIHDITVSGNNIYFSADDGVHGHEIWVSDGKPNGTKMIRDLYPGYVSSDPSYLIDVNGT